MLLKNSPFKAIPGVLTLISAMSPALAHGLPPALPLLKATKIAHQVLFRTPGLSRAASASLNQTSQLTQAGINNGISQSLTRALQGNITSGQINGTYYEAVNGSQPFTQYHQPRFIVALGNSPYSTNGLQGTVPIPTTIGNQLSFASSSVLHGSVLRGGAIALPYQSASQRALANRLKLVAENATALGQKIGNSTAASPIVAGNFFGTEYYQYNPGVPPYYYTLHGIFDLSFGRDPLNVTTGGGSVNLNLSSLRNYIQLANGKVLNYSSGLLAVSGYYDSGPFQGNRIFAIGSNQYNFFNNYGSAFSILSFSKFPTSYLSR